MTSECEILLQLMTSYFGNFATLEASVNKFSEKQTRLPKDVVSISIPILKDSSDYCNSAATSD